MPEALEKESPDRGVRRVCVCVCVCVYACTIFERSCMHAGQLYEGQLHEETVLLKSLYEQFE